MEADEPSDDAIAQLARRHGLDPLTPSAATTQHLDHAIEGIARRYLTAEPAQLAEEVRLYLTWVHRLLDNSRAPAQHHHLYMQLGYLIGLCQVGARGRPLRRNHCGAGRLHTGQTPAQQASSTCSSPSNCHKVRPTPPVLGGAAAPRSGCPRAGSTASTWSARACHGATRPAASAPAARHRPAAPGGVG